MTKNKSPTGASLLVDSLCAQGVDTVFCVPGESYLAAIDALYEVRDRIRLVVCRHEGGAAFMAEAYGKATGKPGVCFVTRAPGATQACIGIHTAHQDSTPLILFIGQAAKSMLGREAFQEVDYRRMLGPITKWVAEIDEADRMPEFVSRAFHTALNGRRGPVVLSLPEDVLSSEAPHPVPLAKPFVAYRAAPEAAQVDELMRLLGQSRRPLAILGGSGWTSEAVVDMACFLRATGIPVACSFRRQDLFDNEDPQYVGVLGLGADANLHRAIKSADLLLLIGARMGEVPSGGYALLDSPQPVQTLVHVMPSPEELGKVYRADLPILATMPALASALAVTSVPQGLPGRFTEWTVSLREGYASHSTAAVAVSQGAAPAGVVDQAQAWTALRDALPNDVVVTNGAGNYAAFLHRYFRYPSFGSEIAPTSGAMGYGLPAAIGAKLAHPSRPVVCAAGDGCFMMSSHELNTAVRLKLPIVILVFDNCMFGTIRMHQERWFPGRVHGTDLENPDFVALAHSYGAHAKRVTDVASLIPAVLEAFSADRPTLIHIPTDPEAIGPNGTISSIRKKAMEELG